MTAPDLHRVPEALRALHPGADDADVYARVIWSVLTEPGDGVAGRLISAHGAHAALERLIRDAPGDDAASPAELSAARARWMPRLDAAPVAQALERARRIGARLLVPRDPEWPTRLDDLGAHAPHCLWARGDVAALSDAPAVGIVGARASSGYGDHVAGELASSLSGDGVTIVSGAAYGIDGVAHRAALSAGGRTFAFLAGGVDRPYPTGHTELIARIAGSGAVLAETPCGTAPSKWRFLSRNRLIAAASDATVVVEAGARSGSLNTAAHAAALGRPLGAVPGAVTSASSAGCHRVLREFDGVCVTGADDVRELLGLSRDANRRVARAGGDELVRLLDAASTRVPRSVDELARRAGLTPDAAAAAIGLAALDGELERTAEGWRRARSR